MRQADPIRLAEASLIRLREALEVTARAAGHRKRARGVGVVDSVVGHRPGLAGDAGRDRRAGAGRSRAGGRHGRTAGDAACR
ncbi:hypothetical protein G6F57_022103 [Rhizopus arrhizus]|nr:hypothetical protein G6F57_022103 [Rhizopus arrhizus]